MVKLPAKTGFHAVFIQEDAILSHPTGFDIPIKNGDLITFLS